jgi:TolB-like protein
MIRILCLVLTLALPATASRAADAPLPGDPSILLLPFTTIPANTSSDWIGPAIQQNLLNELARAKVIQPLLPPAAQTPIADPAAATQAAKAAGSTFVLYGSYHLNDGSLRITGQVLESATGRHVGAVKATGTLRDLFALEDTLGEQLKRIMKAQVEAQIEPKPAAVAQQPPPQIIVIQPPAPRRNLPDELPWNVDHNLIDVERGRVYYDRDDYYRSYRNYFHGGYGSYPIFFRFGRHHHHHHHRHGPTFFPGGVISGPATFFPGGVIRTGWW